MAYPSAKLTKLELDTLRRNVLWLQKEKGTFSAVANGDMTVIKQLSKAVLDGIGKYAANQLALRLGYAEGTLTEGYISPTASSIELPRLRGKRWGATRKAGNSMGRGGDRRSKEYQEKATLVAPSYPRMNGNGSPHGKLCFEIGKTGDFACKVQDIEFLVTGPAGTKVALEIQ